MDEELDEVEIYPELELLNSHDGKIITLVCSCDEELTPDQYADVLKQFANRIESISLMSEVTSGIIN